MKYKYRVLHKNLLEYLLCYFDAVSQSSPTMFCKHTIIGQWTGPIEFGRHGLFCYSWTLIFTYSRVTFSLSNYHPELCLYLSRTFLENFLILLLELSILSPKEKERTKHTSGFEELPVPD